MAFDPVTLQHLEERWLGKFGQAAKWSFCLKAASMAAEQEIL
jgi:hypothetical protein